MPTTLPQPAGPLPPSVTGRTNAHLTSNDFLLPPFGEKGVAVVPATAVHIDIQKEVARVLGTVGKDKTVVGVTITTDRGVNLAVAHRNTIDAGWLKGGEFGVDLWVGKSGWDRSVPSGGVQILFSR